MSNVQVRQTAAAVNGRKTCPSKRWSALEVERWIVLKQPKKKRPNACCYTLSSAAPVKFHDRVSWSCAGEDTDLSVASYLRARSFARSLLAVVSLDQQT
jgi:hypothetical protein